MNVSADSTKKESLTKNAFLNTLYQVLTIILPFFTAPYLSRVLMADGIGIYSYTQSLVTYFTLGAALGTVSYGTMKISKQRKDRGQYSKTFWEIELLTIFSSAFCLICWIIFSSFYDEYRIYLLILSFNIVAVIFDISWLYSGLEKFRYIIRINSLCKITSLICVFVFIKSSKDLSLYILISSVSVLVSNLSMWLFLPKTICKAKIDFKNIGYHFKQTLVFFAPAIATSIYTVLDKTLIGVLVTGTTTVVEQDGNVIVKKISELEGGYYEQATKLINIIKSISFMGIVGVMMPRASYLYEEKEEKQVKRLINVTFNITGFLTVGAGFGLSAIASTIVPTFFGDGYSNTVPIIYILSPIAFIISVSNVLGGMYYTPSGRRKQSSLFLIIGACINVLLNIPLILVLKAQGAAIASVIAELTITLLYLFKCNGALTPKELFLFIWKKIVSGMVMFFAVFCFTHFFSNLFNEFVLIPVQLTIGVLVYCLMLLILKDRALFELLGFLKTKFIRNKNKEL